MKKIDEEFWNLYYGADYQKRKISAYRKNIDKLEAAIDSLDKNKIYTTDEFIKLFDFGTSSPGDYTIRKNLVLNMMAYKGVDAHIQQNVRRMLKFSRQFEDEEILEKYWGSADTLIKSIESVKTKYVSRCKNKIAEAVAGLLWNGITVTQMPSIKKSDVNCNDMTISVNGVVRRIDPFTMAYVMQVYDDNYGYLFGGRSDITLRGTLSRLNNFSDKTNISFSCSAIMASGAYSRRYNGEDESGRDDYFEARKYKAWVKIFRERSDV